MRAILTKVKCNDYFIEFVIAILDSVNQKLQHLLWTGAMQGSTSCSTNGKKLGVQRQGRRY